MPPNTQTKCKYCGKLFTKDHNRKVYCSLECKKNALREQKAIYQQKRRLMIKRKQLILPEYKKYGMGSYGTSQNGHRKEDFREEQKAIEREMKRLGIKRKRRKQ